MYDSILNTIKKMLGIDTEYDAFDVDVIVNINSIFMALRQMGLGPVKPFLITGPNETWSDFLGVQYEGDLEAVKTYVYLRVKSIFDPPSSSTVQQASDAMIKELEWRLYSEVEFRDEEEV